jgi:membrane-associated phospholipid phosphatase
MLIVIVLVGAGRGELRRGIVAAVGMAAAVVSAELLKWFLPRPDLAPETNALIGSVESLPSGHVTIVMAFTLALFAVSAPCCRRTVIIAGSIVTAIIGVSVILAGWHRPSDVFAGILLAISWYALGQAWMATRRTAVPHVSS